MKKFIYIFIIFLSTLYSQQSYSAEVTEWLKTEIDKILISYQDPALPNEIPIGLKTPIRFGKSNDGLFMMNMKLGPALFGSQGNLLQVLH